MEFGGAALAAGGRFFFLSVMLVQIGGVGRFRVQLRRFWMGIDRGPWPILGFGVSEISPGLVMIFRLQI